jgi:hypothetical protein
MSQKTKSRIWCSTWQSSNNSSPCTTHLIVSSKSFKLKLFYIFLFSMMVLTNCITLAHQIFQVFFSICTFAIVVFSIYKCYNYLQFKKNFDINGMVHNY